MKNNICGFFLTHRKRAERSCPIRWAHTSIARVVCTWHAGGSIETNMSLARRKRNVTKLAENLLEHRQTYPSEVWIHKPFSPHGFEMQTLFGATTIGTEILPYDFDAIANGSCGACCKCFFTFRNAVLKHCRPSLSSCVGFRTLLAFGLSFVWVVRCNGAASTRSQSVAWVITGFANFCNVLII